MLPYIVELIRVAVSPSATFNFLANSSPIKISPGCCGMLPRMMASLILSSLVFRAGIRKQIDCHAGQPDPGFSFPRFHREYPVDRRILFAASIAFRDIFHSDSEANHRSQQAPGQWDFDRLLWHTPGSLFSRARFGNVRWT